MRQICILWGGGGGWGVGGGGELLEGTGIIQGLTIAFTLGFWENHFPQTRGQVSHGGDNKLRSDCVPVHTH